jgi:hypothetical protein
MHRQTRGYWPTKDDALHALERDEQWTKLANGLWFCDPEPWDGSRHSHDEESAVRIARVCMSLGMPKIKAMLITEVMEAVVERLAEVERRLERLDDY